MQSLIDRRGWTSVLLLSALVACGAACGGRAYWHAQPVSASGLLIQPQSVYAAGPLLYVRTTFMNNGPLPVTVVRDGATLVLPDGRVVGRSAGRTTQHRPYVIAPGASHQVWVDFRADGFRWDEVPSANVNWSGAVLVNGTPIALPPTVVASR